jgi:cell division protein FtsZ
MARPEVARRREADVSPQQLVKTEATEVQLSAAANAASSAFETGKASGMSDNIDTFELLELTPRIVVFGVGGAGGNAINNMIVKDLEGVEFIAANTDSQALRLSEAPRRLQMGTKTTRGLGAGARPDVGAKAAEESVDEIRAALDGVNMCFVTAGMGGGTGTGAAPVIARIARELGVLTVGVVTKPFDFEGSKRMRLADFGLSELQKVVDTLIIIPNQNLFRVANERTSLQDAFVMADDVLYQGVKGVTDLMVRPGLVNLDFADVHAVMDEMGKAMMGSGEAEGERRAIEAAERAIDNPLLDEVSLKGARGVLINITGGPDMKLFEVDEAANIIRKEADPDASVFFGSALDPHMEGKLRVSIVATGIDRDDTIALERRDQSAIDETTTHAEVVINAETDHIGTVVTAGTELDKDHEAVRQAIKSAGDAVNANTFSPNSETIHTEPHRADAINARSVEIVEVTAVDADEKPEPVSPNDMHRVEIPSFLRRKP